MTREDIIRMAKEARFYIEDDEAYSPSNQEDFNITERLKNDLTEHLERFAKLVAEHEREACAKLCDELDQKLWEDMGESMSGYGEAIRERT